ncbi:unnamed protein product [Malus baccata var. baccata]
MSQLITRRRSVTNAPPALSASTAPAVSAPLIGEPTPFTEATPTVSQVPVSSTSLVSVEPFSTRRLHRCHRDPEPSDHTSSASRVEGEASHPGFSPFKGPSRMLKQTQRVRLTDSKIKIEYDPQHRGAATSQQHSSVGSSCGVFIRQNCPMQWESWAEIFEETKKLVIYDLRDISLKVMAYLEGTLATRYKHWKNNLHTYFKQWDDLKIACLHGPIELQDRPEDWEWLCKHFTDPNFVGSKFPEIDLFEDVYATMVEKHIIVLQEATSQLTPETPIGDVTVHKDAGFQILTDVLDQNFGRCHGKVVQCMGKVRVRETGASSSRSNTANVNALKEEMTTLKGHLAV